MEKSNLKHTANLQFTSKHIYLIYSSPALCSSALHEKDAFPIHIV